ncbi:RES family NAD+ phosphorylase [Herbaspirillum sp. SJZ107]|uniref:RES family NAD+ phosphorylase n=1 Tax=Herbaspirillum sp. SJZ107 TaxID=2572881 RepID=UPI00114D8AB1|nr:RES domain-containing protein [Herbaspirillum sp. SJZ107]TQK03150.1 RES domain-containing protein [Herbaspirillum sp. SJZ107]
MKTTRLDATAYRVHTPRWAHAPLSGAGAARVGGRANRPGVPALYLSLELETALAEYRQLSPLMPPGLMVTYLLGLGPLVDLRDGVDAAWDPLWNDFYCDWRALYFDKGVEPPSWVMGDIAMASGTKGIVFPSVLVAGINLVLYTELLDANDRLSVYDPDGGLPRNQRSWEEDRAPPAP